MNNNEHEVLDSRIYRFLLRDTNSLKQCVMDRSSGTDLIPAQRGLSDLLLPGGIRPMGNTKGQVETQAQRHRSEVAC